MPTPIVPTVPVRVRYRYLQVETLDPARDPLLRRLRLVRALIGVGAVAAVLFAVAVGLFGMPGARNVGGLRPGPSARSASR